MKITVDAKDVTKKMYLRTAIATGETNGGTKFEVSSVTPDGSLHYRIGDKSYLVDMHDVLAEILKKVGDK